MPDRNAQLMAIKARHERLKAEAQRWREKPAPLAPEQTLPALVRARHEADEYNRYSQARAVACQEVEIPYGPVLHPTGRPECVETYHDERKGKLAEYEPGARLSYEMVLNKHGQSFIDGGTVAFANQQGWNSRQARKEVRQRCGLVEPIKQAA